MLLTLCPLLLMLIGASYGDPTAKIILESVDMKIEDNPYVGAWTATIDSTGEKLSMKTPVKKDFPPNMMLKIATEIPAIGGIEIEMTVCEAFEDVTIGKDLLERGIPAGKFPKSCPVKAGDTYEISNWVLPAEKVPPGIPDTQLDGTMSMYEPGKEPFMTMHAKAKLVHKIPGLPGGMGR